ncbi:MAG: anti-sigma factor [Gemmatimonadaceae bacterium]|nr:anti-sigma factor [Gemmatimonadaceae bacterium]
MSFPLWRPAAGRRHATAFPASTLRAAAGAVVALALATACGGGGGGESATAPAGPTRLMLTTSLPALVGSREGRYEAWAEDRSGAFHSLGRFDAGGTVTLATPATGTANVVVTVEPPGDADALPSEQVVLRGALVGDRAELRYEGAITQSDLPLLAAPGQFTMFSPSDNDSLGYPSHEEAGIWLFNMDPARTAQKDYYVRVTQLQRGWTYEGWMVRDLGQTSEIWLSYGKFVPDWTGALNQPDDTGWGPFSGVLDFRRARLEDFPGDDWISNPLHLPWPAELTLPLNLREKDAQGRLRWSHVITIEPASDRGEPIGAERPFFLRPYVDPFGDLPPGVARTITFHPETLPHGSATVQ